MAIPKVPGFPYFFLVRLPVGYLLPLACLLNWSRLGHVSQLLQNWLATILVPAFLVGVALQLLWVPMGGIALLTSSIRLSPYLLLAHLLAMLCGAMQVVLIVWASATVY